MRRQRQDICEQTDGGIDDDHKNSNHSPSSSCMATTRPTPPNGISRRLMSLGWILLLLNNTSEAFQLSLDSKIVGKSPIPAEPFVRRRFVVSSSTTRTSSLVLSASPGGSGGGGGKNPKKKNLSASEQARRDEEKRRRARKDDVVIGKTSAKSGAQDYALDVEATQQEWMRQASRDEQLIYQYTEEGMQCLKQLDLKEADHLFTQVFQLKPQAYLWQAGVVKFYLGQFPEGAEILARNAATFESKFGGPASEERIWRDACELKYIYSLSKKERKALLGAEDCDGIISERIPRILQPQQPDDDDDKDEGHFITPETRKPIRLARDLFGASVARDHSAMLVARAKLRSLAGEITDTPRPDLKLWKVNSWFYLGLHYDAIGDVEESKTCLKMALRLFPNSSANGGDIIHTLPLLHMATRDWFDDDDIEAEVGVSTSAATKKSTYVKKRPSFKAPESTEIQRNNGMTFADPLIEASIEEGVSKMTHADLKDALRLRGLKVTGAKEELQERLFYSLMDDAGYDGAGFAP